MDQNLKELGANCIRNMVCGEDASDLESAFEVWRNDIGIILSAHFLSSTKAAIDVDKIKSERITTRIRQGLPVGDKRSNRQKNSKKNDSSAINYSSALTDSKSSLSCACNSVPDENNRNSNYDCCQNHSEEKHVNEKVVGNELGSITTEEEEEEEEEDIINNALVGAYEDLDDENNEENNHISSQEIGTCGEGNETTLDLEDLGTAIYSNYKTDLKSPNVLSNVDNVNEQNREMVTRLQRKSLTKVGYKIIGTHSAVKLCR
jgi:tRNA wybutosine-synthesizing protein 1